MQNKQQRPRGRPKGTGKDDSAALRRIADLIVADPSLKATTAMKRTRHNTAADIRRLQVKWKAGGEALLADARRRRDESAEARPAVGMADVPVTAFANVGAVMQEVARVLESPVGRLLREQERMLDALEPSRTAIRHWERQQRAIRLALGPLENVRKALGPLDELQRLHEQLNALFPPR